MGTAKILCEIQDLIGTFSWERAIKINGLLDSSTSFVNEADVDERLSTVVVEVLEEDERRMYIHVPGKHRQGPKDLWVSKSLEI